jgi:DNA-binding NtrC family response regulator
MDQFEKMERIEKKTALVVDDSPLILKLCTAVLSDLGYDVLTAFSGQDALHVLEAKGESVTVLLTDIVMTTDREGIELAEQAISRFPHIRVIYMSGHSEKWIAANPDKPGSPLFLPKPFFISNLVEIIEAAERMPV